MIVFLGLDQVAHEPVRDTMQSRAVLALLLLCLGTGVVVQGIANLTETQLNEIDDRIIHCITAQKEIYTTYAGNECRFLALDSIQNEKTKKEDLTDVIEKCLKGFKKPDGSQWFSKDTLETAEKCLKKELKKPLTSK